MLYINSNDRFINLKQTYFHRVTRTPLKTNRRTQVLLTWYPSSYYWYKLREKKDPSQLQEANTYRLYCLFESKCGKSWYFQNMNSTINYVCINIVMSSTFCFVFSCLFVFVLCMVVSNTWCVMFYVLFVFVLCMVVSNT